MALSEGYREVPILKGENCHWKDISINTGASQPVLQDVNYPDASGGYTYRQPGAGRGHAAASQQTFRTIFWRTSQLTLELLEVSASQDLIGNALRLNFQDTPIVPRVFIQETYSEVVVMVTTTNRVYRLLFLHPSKTHRKDSLQSTLPVPSIFASASVTHFRDPSNFHEFNHGGTVTHDLQCSSAWLTTEGKAWFALGTKGGSLLLLCLTPIGLKGVSFQEEVREASIMQRLWSGIVPGVMRRGQEAPDTAHSVVVHPFSQGTVAFAICRDHKLRAWSCTNQECKISLDLRELLSNGSDLAEEPPLLQHAIRSAVGTSINNPTLGVFLSLSSSNVFLVVQPFVHSGQYQIRHLATIHGLRGATLIDFALDETDIVATWSTPSGDLLTQQFPYKGSRRRDWRTVSGPVPPPSEVDIAEALEPREAYMDVIFQPGYFSTSCIAKALHTYCRMVGSAAMVTSNLHTDVDTLRAEASAVIESEIQQKIGGAVVGQEEYTLLVEQSLARFYSCCLEYQRVADKPGGLARDVATGMIHIVKKDAVSVLVPSDHVIQSHDQVRPVDLRRMGWIPEDDTRLREDIWRLYKSVQLLRELIPEDHYNSLSSSGADVQTTVKNMAAAVISSPDVSMLTQSLEGLHRPSTALRLLLGVLDLADGRPEELLPNEDFIYNAIPDTRLFGAHSSRVLSSSLSTMAADRFRFTLDLLLLECIMDTNGLRPTSDSQLQFELQESLIGETVKLMQGYLTLHRVSQWEATPVIPGSVESSTRQMAALEISDLQMGGVAKPAEFDGTTNPTLVELFISGSGGVHMRAILSQGEGQLRDWNTLLHHAVLILAKLMWPISASFVFPEFLMNKCQYANVERYVNLLDGWCEWNAGSRKFILGQSHLNLGAPEKAVACFTQATNLATREDYLLSKILPTDELEGKKMDTVYHLKVIRLLEQFSVPDLIIEYSYSALSFAGKDDRNIPTLWTKIFKHELALGHQEKAYAAITANPDPECRRDCLRQFVVVLCDRGQSKDLVQFPCIDLHDEMVSILEERARSVDLESNSYYDLLYVFHIQRGNYRKAASAMYEHASRLSAELPGVAGLQRQHACYLATLNTLRIVDPRYQWIVKPVAVTSQPRDEDLMGASPKRDHDGEPRDIPVTRREVKVLEMRDIEMEYLLVSARWKLVHFDPEYNFIAGTVLGPPETVTSLVRAGLFDCAIDVCQTFKLSLKPVFETLASKCVKVSRNGPDSKTWQWLAANTATKLPCSKESRPADLTWGLLKAYLSRHYQPGDSSHYKTVTAKLLTLGYELPQWLVKRLKLVDYPALLRLYISYDKLEEASTLAEELISAMLGEIGESYKDFGIKAPLRATVPSVWLPYTSLDHILLALKDTTDASLLDVYERLDSKLQGYLQQVKTVSDQMQVLALEREARWPPQSEES